jgi:hypothetical protein
MPQVIIFPDFDESGALTGGIRVIHRAPGCAMPIEELARKDVAQGMPYRIMQAADLPADRTFRAAWEADFSEPHGFGDPDGWWAEQAAREATADAVAAAEREARETAIAAAAAVANQEEQPE